MPQIHISMRTVKTGPGFRTVTARFQRNMAILPVKTAANIADLAAKMAPVWHGRTNPGVTGTATTYPVPGYLANSIHAVGNTVYVGAYYGIYVEFGTRYMHQEPFLRPAAQLVWRTQFNEDVRHLFDRDIALTGNGGLVGLAPGAIAYHHVQHAAARMRNLTRTPAQRRFEVHRRFTTMRSRGLHMGGITVRI